MIHRKLTEHFQSMFKIYPIITLTGPRQSGKTTLCRSSFPDLPYVNFEKPDTLAYFKEDPNRFLRTYEDGAIFDEFQRVPELPSWLQVMVDEKKKNGRFILTGSNQLEVMTGISQSLAGRTSVMKLLPFSLEELRDTDVEIKNVDQILYTGFYPRIIAEKLDPSIILSDYTQTYIERDVRQISEIKNLNLFIRFLKLCAGRVGQLLNLHSLANDTGVSAVTARQWISILEASYLIFLLPPFFENINKRLIKSPKLYFYDTGLAAYLMGIEESRQIETHPLRGSLFENMVIGEILKYVLNRGKESRLHFYRDSNGIEIDLLYPKANDFLAIEIKSSETVNTDYFRNLKLVSRIFKERFISQGVIYGGSEKYSRKSGEVIPFQRTSTWLDSSLLS